MRGAGTGGCLPAESMRGAGTWAGAGGDNFRRSGRRRQQPPSHTGDRYKARGALSLLCVLFLGSARCRDLRLRLNPSMMPYGKQASQLL
ncbi:hypothetical protein AXF42_Ash021363 [Apostasia shenzhenica]|uniref:Uncharacterized protein n=1 Tax=Apostasia shenzhenica TaxID=1088818 RepID=A0A2H9ZY31_9ASPA|nr:hypothetical protein AXF42_Ash021363 [Apostasia shenzhenica]